MTGRMVGADEARQWHEQEDSLPDDVAFHLAHTVVVQAEQIAAVMKLHADQDGQCGWCCWGESSEGAEFADYPCPTARALGVTS